MIEMNEIIDNDFMDKDVSELVVGDYYLFALHDNFMYFYKDGIVLKCCLVTEGIVSSVNYTKGSLSDYVANIKGGVQCVHKRFYQSATNF